MFAASARSSLGVLPLISRPRALLRGANCTRHCTRPNQWLQPSIQQRLHAPARAFSTSRAVYEDESKNKSKKLPEKGEEADEKNAKRHGQQKKADDRPWHRLSGSKQYKETSPDPSGGDESKGIPKIYMSNIWLWRKLTC